MTTQTEAAPTSDGQGGLDEHQEDSVPTYIECPACIAAPLDFFCPVCELIGVVPLFGDVHALHRAGGPQVFIEDDMVAIRVPSYASHRAVGIDLPLATFRWLVHQGSVALHDSDLAAAERAVRA